MKDAFISFIILFLVSDMAWADCDWNTGITPGPNHTYVYSEDCHLAVGNLVQSNKTQTKQITDLTKAIQLKDLALTAADSRTILWQNASDKELNSLNTIQSDQKRSDWLYFGLGAITVLGAGYMAAKLIGH